MKALIIMRFTKFTSQEKAYFVTFGIHDLSVICDSFILLGIMIAVFLLFTIALIKQLFNDMLQVGFSRELQHTLSTDILEKLVLFGFFVSCLTNVKIKNWISRLYRHACILFVMQGAYVSRSKDFQ